MLGSIRDRWDDVDEGLDASSSCSCYQRNQKEKWELPGTYVLNYRGMYSIHTNKIRRSNP
jgi:hypothetical protein